MLLAGIFLLLCAAQSSAVETMRFRRFGTLSVYRPSAAIKHVIFFLSGDGGWNKGTDERARDLTTLNSLVVGIDSTFYAAHIHLEPEGCYNPASDFETLGKVVEKHLKMQSYAPPILLGYSLGATLVYGILVQAPAHTFAGAISMGFCPDMPLDKPLCRVQGTPYSTKTEKGYSFLPSGVLQDPWLVFQGVDDAVCSETVTAEFVKQVAHGKVVLLPKVGHGFRVESNWLPQFKEAFRVFDSSPE